METLITASIGLVVSITNAAQQVKTLRQKCHALAKQVQLLQPFLKEVLEQARLKNRGEKLFSANDENAFKNLHSALERANKILLDLQRTNRVKVALMASALTGDLSDVSNDIQVCLGGMSLVGLQIAADMKANLDIAKESLGMLRDDLRKESSHNASQLQELEQKILDAIQHQGSLLTLLQSKEEPLRILADHFSTDPESIKMDLQGLSDFVDWRAGTKKKAAVEELFEQVLLALGELDRQEQSQKQSRSCDTCSKTIRSIQDLECPICKQQFTEPVVISSGITYCKLCIERALGTDMKCPVSRQVVSRHVYMNIAVANILRMPATGSHGKKPDERWSPRPIASHTRWDLRTAVNEFRSGKPGSKVVGLISLQAHCESLAGKKEVLSEAGLLPALVEYLFCTEVGRVPGTLDTELCLHILDALTSAPKQNVASSSSAPQTAITFVELDALFDCLSESGLENLVRLMDKATPMANCRILAAKVMSNVIEGSLKYFSIARGIPGLVTSFFDLAIRGGESSHIGVEGLALLAYAQRCDPFDAGNIQQRDEILIRALMDLTRYGIALEESLVALGAVVVSLQGHVSNLLEDVSHLVSSVAQLSTGAGTNAVMKILLRMATESVEEGHEEMHRSNSGVPLREVVASFVPRLLDMGRGQVAENRFEGQEECIMLLGFGCKSGGWRLEPEQVPCLFDILFQDTASNEARIGVLDILAANTENRRLWMPDAFDCDRVLKLLELIKPQPADPCLRRGVSSKLCALLKAPVWLDQILKAGGANALSYVIANDEDKLCRCYAIIALERLPRVDTVVEALRKNLSLKQLVQVFQIHGVDEECVGQALGAAAALMCTVISETESESSMIEAMEQLVIFLQGKAVVSHKEKAAEALAELICRTGEIAREWVVASRSNVLSVLVEFASNRSTDLGWRDKLYESLAMLSHHVDCQKAVTGANGQLLLLEALQTGKQNAALALVALLVRDDECTGVDLDTVVIAMKLRLQRKVVDPTLVEAFGKLCGTAHTGISVANNGGIEVLLNLVKRFPDCRAASALALSKLASLKVVDDGDEEQCSLAVQLGRCRALIVEHGGVDILFEAAGCEGAGSTSTASSKCLEAVEALAALAEQSSAKSRLAERVVGLRAICMEGGRFQELGLQILMFLSRESLSQDAVSKLLANGFPELLLTLLKTPSSLSATTAVKMLRNLSVESPEFRKAMLHCGEGAVKALLDLLREPAGLEIREFAVVALEMFMKEEKGRKQLIDSDGIELICCVLERRQVQGLSKVYALKVLLLLADPPLAPKHVRKHAWSQICSAHIFHAVREASMSSSPGDALVAAQLVRACALETSDMSALCKKLKEANVLSSLAKLRTSSSNPVLWKEVDELVHLLAKKSNTARKALKEEIDRSSELNFDAVDSSGAFSPSHSVRSNASRD